MSVSILRDVFFAIAFAFFFIFWVEIVVTRGARLAKPTSLLGFSLVSLLATLFRHNGMPVIFFSLLVLVVAMKEIRGRVIISLVMVFALFATIKGPLLAFLHVDKTGTYFEVVYELFHLDAHVIAGTNFSDDGKAILNQIKPPGKGRWSYDCRYIGWTIDVPGTDLVFANNNHERIRELFLETLWQAPLVNLSHLLCSGAVAWKINVPGMNLIDMFKADENRLYTIYPNAGGWQMESKIPWLVEPIWQLYRLSTQSGMWWLLWSPAFYFYLFLFGVLIKSLKGGKRFLLLAVPVLGISLSLVAVNGSQNFRYMYPVYVVSLLYWPFLYTTSSDGN
jgi:hypothetical protein